MKNLTFFAKNILVGFLLVISLVVPDLCGQTLISPTADGGFETGNTFALNGWTAVNGANNRWYVGNAPVVSSGTRCVFIGSNGTTWSGTANSSVNHFYKDISFPAGATNIQLSFKYKVIDPDAMFDYLKIWLVPITTTPVAGNQLFSGQIGLAGGYDTPTAWTTATISGLDLNAGTTKRLVFSWRADGISPNAAIAVDEIALTYIPGPPCSGVPVGGNTMASITDGCSGYSSVLSVAGSSVESGLTYQWQSGPSASGPWTDVGGATSAVYSATVNANVYYRRVVTCSANGFSENSVAVGLTVSPCIVMANGTITTCSGYFFDNGGVSDYTANQDLTMTVCATAGLYPQVDFSSFYTESVTLDYLQIYDGNSTAAPLLGTWGGTSTPGVVTGTNTCLTYRFHSDGSVQYAGWVAELKCLSSCSGIPSGGNAISSGCSNYSSTISVSGTIPTGGVVYQWQSAPTSTGPWTNVAGATNATYTATISADIYYRRVTTCTASGLSANSTPVQLTMASCLPPPCSANPVAGDFVTTATAMCNLNGYCGNTSSAYTADSPGNLSFCGNIDNNSWLSFVADDITATLNVFVSNCTYGDGIQMEVYSTTDFVNFTSHSNCWNPAVQQDGTIIATALIPGQTYYLMIDGYAGDVCDYVISASSGVMIADAGPDISICGGQNTTLHATGGANFQWSPTTGLSNPNIANPIANPSATTTYTVSVTGGNSLCPLLSTDQVTVTVVSAAPTAGNNSPFCAGSALNLSSLPNGAVAYAWSGPNSFVSNVQNPTIPAVTTAAAGVYTVTVTITGGCTGTAQTTAVVNPMPVIIAPANITQCAGTVIAPGNNVSIPAGATYTWTNSNPAIGLAASGTGQVPGFMATNATGASISATITVTPTIGTCVGAPITYTITVNPLPMITAPANITQCAGTAVAAGSIVSIPAGATYTWANSNPAIGLAASGSGQVPGFTATNATGSPISGIITVTPTIGTCVGAPITYTITVNPLPIITAPANITQCAGTAVSAGSIVSIPAGATYTWTNSNPAIGLAAGGIGQVPGFMATNATGTPISGIVTITPTLGTCAGTPIFYTITVNPLPVITAPTDITQCAGTAVAAGNIVSIPAGATFTWTNSNPAIGLAASGTGQIPGFTATNATGTPISGIVTVTPTLGSCVGTPISYTITINPMDNPAFSYAPSTMCQTGVDPVANITGGATGTFTSNPAGLVFLNTTTGVIDVSASALNSYTVTFTTNGACSSVSNYSITITSAPVATFSYSGPFCNDGADPSPIFPVGASSGIFSAVPAGLVFVNTSTGQIDLSASAAGTYTVTNNIPAAGGCASSIATTSVTITALPTATIFYNGSPWCTSSGVQPVSLTGTNAYTGGTYSSTSGLTINATTGQITPSTSTAGTYTVTYTIAATGGCAQVTVTTTVVITAPPTATISYTGSPWCSSSGVQPVSLTGTNAFVGGIYSSTAGLAIIAASGQITPSTSTAGTYIVTYTAPASGGCPSIPATTSVTITALPTATISYAGSPWCTSSGVQPVTLIGTNAYTGGTYSSTSGLTLNAATGQITPSTSTAGTYTVTYTTAATGGCAQVTATASINITAPPTATIAYSGSPWCSSAGIQPVLLTGTNAFVGGTYSSTAGLTINAVGGQITPNTSTAGTYIVTYTAPASGGCPSVPATTSVTITALPTATISYTGSPWCTSSGVQPVSLTGANAYTGGVYSSTAGLTINATTGQITPSTSTAGTYTVTYTITATGGCAQVTATTTVTITAPPTATIAYSGSPWCSSAGIQPVLLTGTNAFAGGLFTSTSGLTINAANGQIMPSTSTPGIYDVIYTTPASGGCLSVLTSTSVTITALPTVVISYDGSPWCLTTGAQSATLSGTGAYAGGVYTSTAGLSINATTGQITPNASSAGNYTVQYTTVASGGCPAVLANTSVSITPLPIAHINNLTGTNVLTCNTPSISVIASGGLNYHWSGGSTPASAANSFATPGIYTVTVSTSNGCTATSNIVITQDTVTPQPNIINSTGLTALDCNTQSINVQAFGGNAYRWNGGVSPLTDVNDFIASGTYVVTVTGHNGCTATADIVITQIDPVVLSLTHAVADHCGLGIGEATVNATGGNGHYYYSWNTTPIQSNATATRLTSGSYRVIVSDGECGDTLHIKIADIPGPVAAFEAIPKMASISNPEIRFHNQSYNAEGFLWSFGDGDTGFEENPVHFYSESGDFSVTLTVVDSYGCMDSVSHSVKIFDNLNVFIPNTFTPNGDGINDEFKPIGRGYGEKGYKMTIYNRWGQKVFTSSLFEKGWDGRIDDEKLDVNGVFVYVIVVYDINGKEYRFKGHVTMLGSKSYDDE